MSRISPKPNITEVVRSWALQPAMTFEVAVDQDGAVWVVETCPVGRHYWTADQAAQLCAGHRTRPVLEEAIALARERMSLDRLPALPVLDAELETAIAGDSERGRSLAPSRDHLARA